MTPLKHRVTRETIDEAWQGRKLVVSLTPGDIIEVREKGRRKTFAAPLSWVAMEIIKRNVEAERANGRKRRTAKRSLLQERDAL
jgi:hypothetical protein